MSRDLFYFPRINELSKKSSFLKAVHDSVFTSTDINQLLILHNNKLTRKNLGQSKYGEVTDVIKFHQSYYVSTKSYVMGFDKLFENAYFITSKMEKGKVRGNRWILVMEN